MSSLVLALAALIAPAKGQAQSNTDIQLSGASTNLQLLTAEQRDGRGEIEFVVSWTVLNRSGKTYRLSYTSTDTGSSPIDLVEVLPNSQSQNFGTISSNSDAGTFLISEDHLLERAAQTPQQTTTPGALNIFMVVFPVDNENQDQLSGSLSFEYDLRAPPGPTVDRVLVGERTIELAWTAPNSDEVSFEVQYCSFLDESDLRARTSTSPRTNPDTNTDRDSFFEIATWPCADNLRTRSNIGQDAEEFTIDEGIQEQGWSAFTVVSEDEAPFSNLTSPDERIYYAVKTSNIADFFELQHAFGGEEDGGFCFIATAAYGSYAHPVVYFYRMFRDYVLAPLPGGRDLIEAYYQHSPPWAEYIAHRPWLARIVRCLLVLAAMALVALPLVLIGWGVRFVHRRLRWGQAILLLISFYSSTHSSVSWAAEAVNLRGKPTNAVGVQFEIKAGPYEPALAVGVSEGGSPSWERVYGTGDRVMFALGGDLQFYRGRYGTLSVGGSAGFVEFPGNGQVVDEFGNYQGDGPRGTSTFAVIPMTLTLGYRFDALMDYTPVPLAPYVRGGLAYSLWWNTRDDGALSRFEVKGEERQGIGGKLGLTGTVGLSLALNALDRFSAASLRRTTGIRTTYLFFEGQFSWVNGFGGSGFNLSTNTWFGGLMLEI